MANKNTNMILAVAVIAVCAIAIIGVGYAYTATTQNSGNDASVKYITLSQGNDTTVYSDTFDKKITYDTTTGVEGDAVVTEFTLTPGQAVENFAVQGKTAIALGTVTINVGKNTSNTDSFRFCVKDITGGSSMVGNYYIGITVGSESEAIREYTIGQYNYYKAIVNTDENKHAAVISGGDPIALPNTGTLTIEVTMYYAPGLATAVPDESPLENVTFEFKAEAPTA